MSGRLYIFDGVDGAGKTTLIHKVANALRSQDKKVHVQPYPSNRLIGQLIRDTMLRPNAISPQAYMHLFVADGLDVEADVQYMLAGGYTILADRHPISSSFAYQLKYHSVDNMFSVCRPGMFTNPNAVFIVDVPSNIALERIQKRGAQTDIYESVRVQEVETRRARYTALWSMMNNVVLLDGLRDDNDKTVLNIMSQVDKLILSKN